MSLSPSIQSKVLENKSHAYVKKKDEEETMREGVTGMVRGQG